MKTDLFLMSGQSNMEGQSEAPCPYRLPDEYGIEYKQLTDTVVALDNPSGEDITNDKGENIIEGAWQGFGGLTVPFAESYYNNCGRFACYVHAAKGATTVSQWQKGTPIYNCVVSKYRGAEKYLKSHGYEIERRNLVWLQGESDGIMNVTCGQYTELLKTFWHDIKSELGLDNLLIIRVARFCAYPVDPIILAQEEMTAYGKNTVNDSDILLLTRINATFDIENGLMQGDTAPFHYTNAGYKTVGNAAGANASRLLNGLPAVLEADAYGIAVRN